MWRNACVWLGALCILGLAGPALAQDDEEENVIEMPPMCVNRTPVKKSEPYKECTGEGEKVCAVWDPPKSSQCEAELNRSEGVTVHYDYFGQADCRSSD